MWLASSVRAERILKESGMSIAPPMCACPSTSTQLPPPPDPIAGCQRHLYAARAQSSNKPSHDRSHSDSSHDSNNGEDNEDNEDNTSNRSNSSNSNDANEDSKDNEDSDNGNDSEDSDNNNNNNKDNSDGSKGEDNSNEEEGTKPIDEPCHINTLAPSTLAPNTFTPDIIVTDTPMTNMAHKAHNPTNDVVPNTLTTTTPVTDTPTTEAPPKNTPGSTALRTDDAPTPNTVSTNTLVALPSNVDTLAPGKYSILHINIYCSFFYCFVDLNACHGDTGRQSL